MARSPGNSPPRSSSPCRAAVLSARSLPSAAVPPLLPRSSPCPCLSCLRGQRMNWDKERDQKERKKEKKNCYTLYYSCLLFFTFHKIILLFTSTSSFDNIVGFLTNEHKRKCLDSWSRNVYTKSRVHTI